MDRTPDEFETIDEAMRHITGPKNESGLTVAEWAYRLGHATSTMYAKGNTVDYTLADLVKITAHGFLLPLRWLARVGHAVVFVLPKKFQGNPLTVKTAESVIKFGKLLKTLAQAQDPDSPGGVDITVAEAIQIKSDAMESIAVQAGIVEIMDRIIERGEG